jgi:hypothetical protein
MRSEDLQTPSAINANNMAATLRADKLAELKEFNRIITLATDANADLFAALKVPHHFVSRLAHRWPRDSLVENNSRLIRSHP